MLANSSQLYGDKPICDLSIIVRFHTREEKNLLLLDKIKLAIKQSTAACDLIVVNADESQELLSLNKPKFSVIKDISADQDSRISDQVNLNKCKIGEGTKIDAFVYIQEGVSIGNNVKILPFTFIPTGVKIADNVFVGPNVIFTNDRYPKIDSDWQLLRTLVKEGASIGAGCVILPGTTIGKNAMIGAGSVVTKDVPDDAVAAGIPAKILGKHKKKI